MLQVKDKESELKGAEQKLHDEFERMRRQNAEEKRQLDDKKKQLVRCPQCAIALVFQDARNILDEFGQCIR